MWKRFLAGVLCLLLCIAPAMAEDDSRAVGERLGFQLLRELYSDGNCVISPVSLAMALGMAAEGASGETRSEILSALEAEEISDVLNLIPEDLRSANALFSAPDIELKAAYIRALEEEFAAEADVLDADALRRVNAWVEEKTDGLIEELLSQPPSPEMRLMLINAVAMDAAWASPFKPAGTFEQDFHAPEGDVPVEMMHQTEDFLYGERDGLQLVCLPYAQSDLRMWIIVPGEGVSVGLSDALDLLCEVGLGALTGGAERRQVSLSLPKMDVSCEISMEAALEKLGVKSAFSGAADFSGISDEPLMIDSVLQKARVQVDEDGTRAAAVTAIVMECSAMAPENTPVEMRVDRPFLFVIADGARGTVCFAGAVESVPGAKAN